MESIILNSSHIDKNDIHTLQKQVKEMQDQIKNLRINVLINNTTLKNMHTVLSRLSDHNKNITEIKHTI